MAFDLEAWTKELGLTDAERAIVAPVLQTRIDKLEAGQLRQSEFSRKLNELNTERQKLQQDIDTRAAALNEDYGRLGKWEGEVKELRKKDLEELDKKSRRLASLEQHMRRIGSEHGVDVESILADGGGSGGGNGNGSGGGNGNGNGNGSGAVDERYFTREDWTRAQRDISLFPQVAAEMDDIVDDVRELTGDRVRRAELLKELQDHNSKLPATAPKVSMRQFAEEKYKLSEKRQQLQEKKQKEHDDRIRTETETRVRSEVGISTPRPADNRRSPVLSNAAEKGKTATQRPDYRQPAATGVGRAVAAYQEGKYSAA